MRKQKRNLFTKAELLEHDRERATGDPERDEEFEKTKEKYERAEENFMSQIVVLKAMIIAFNNHSLNFFDKQSCPELENQEVHEEMKFQHKPCSVKELLLVMEDRNNEDVDEDDCVAIDHPSSQGIKVK